MTRTLAVFGLSGRTGQALARAAHARGWEVRGFARPDSRLPLELAASTIRSTFDDTQALNDVVADTDAVCCVLGPRSPHTDVFCAAATDAIVQAMTRTGGDRLLCQTGAMIGPDAGNRSRPMRWMAQAFARRQPDGARDRLRQEEIVQTSGLRWTLVKPPRLADGPARHRVRAGPAQRVGLLSRISRADLAEFLIAEIEGQRFVRQRVYVVG